MIDDTKVLRPTAVAVLIAAIVMIGATFAPFATQGCISCPLGLVGAPYHIPAVSLFHGLDGWIVLFLAVALALAAAALSMRFRRTIAAIATLALSAAALAVVIFEGVDVGGRVIGWDAATPPMELGPHGPVPYVPAKALSPPVYVDGGSTCSSLQRSLQLLPPRQSSWCCAAGTMEVGHATRQPRWPRFGNAEHAPRYATVRRGV